MSVLKIKTANNQWQAIPTLTAEAVSNLILDGFTMVSPPTFTDGSFLYTDSATQAVGNIGTNANLSVSDYVPVMGRNTLIIMLPWYSDSTPTVAGLVFYDKNKSVLPFAGTNDFWGRTAGGSDPRAKTAEVFVPQNAAYFRTTWWSTSVLSTYPDTPAFTYTFTPGNWLDDAITHEMPTCRGMENAIRRARQYTDIEWTSLVRIPRMTGVGTDEFTAGKKYRGIPYSGAGQTNSWTYGQIVPTSDSGKWGWQMFFYGHVVSPEQFVTASRFANSIFGERKDLVADTVDASIYGGVCSALVTYALGLPYPIWPLPTFMSNASYGKNYFNELGQLGTDIALSSVRLCDVFYNSNHIAIITDILRDSQGNVKAVEITEETTSGKVSKGAPLGEPWGGISRRRMWLKDDLLASTWASNYVMYRFKSFTDISYTQSIYVDTGNEGNKLPPIDLPCIPYLGSGARYKAGYLPNTKVLIAAPNDYVTLVVTKDGEAFNSFTINGASEISVGFSVAGSYEAHLVNSNNKSSVSCTWTVE